MTGCDARDDPNRTTVALIGALPRSADPDRGPMSANDSLLARETAQGLVAIDAGGQVEPGLAESWIVTDDGRSYIFRIQRMTWPDGRDVTSEDVAASLRKAIAANSRNTLRPYLSAIDAVIGMTGRVVEIRLKTPRPNLLQLLAQPELGVRNRGFGSGPWRIASRTASSLTLQPIAAGEGDRAPDDRRVTLKGGRAALGIARFLTGSADAVLGGTFADWPLVAVSGLTDQEARIDPAEGLFGIGIIPRSAFLRDRDNRMALAMAIDRVELVRLFEAGRWKATDHILPAQMDSARPPAMPDWLAIPGEQRIATARQQVARWIANNAPPAPLRLVAPDGPGTRLLIARLNADLRRIALSVERVDPGSRDVDLRLVDAIAPNVSANWYLTRTGCEAGFACSETGQIALETARLAPTLNARAVAMAQADAETAKAQGFIALAKPLRWSLVARKLTGFRENSFAVHRLGSLRAPRDD